MNYESYIEKLMQHFTGKEFAEEVTSAKKEFHDRAGLFDEGTGDYEMKMSQFSDWFLFIRPFGKIGRSPVEIAATQRAFPLTDEDKVVFTQLLNSVHSLFEFNRVRDRDVWVTDLFSGDNLQIKDSEVSLGFNKDEIFEGRLIPHGPTFVFSRSFCFHPSQAKGYILKEIAKAKTEKSRPESANSDLGWADLNAKEALILRIFRMRYKYEQYRHVDIKEIYSHHPRLRL